MTFKMSKILIFFIFCIGKSLECLQKNTSCNDIKTPDGFKFLHEGPEGSEIFVLDNKTVIAHALLPSQSFRYVNEVMSMDKYSIITRNCRDLQVKCIVPYGKDLVKEFCLDYKITVEMMQDGPPTPWRLIIGVSLPVAVLFVATGIIGVLCYKKQLGTATLSRFRCLLCCIRLGTFHTVAGEEEAGLGEMPSDPDPRGSGEGVIEQDNTLESVHVHSPADDKPAQSLNLDCNLINEEVQPSENGDRIAPDVNRATNHRAMHRNLGDDPGGVNDNKGKDIPREMHNGRTLGDCGEDHEDEGQSLLFSQRAAIRGSDMTGEAAVLVNKRDFEPDQVSRCSTAPDTDVESTSNTKSYTQA